MAAAVAMQVMPPLQLLHSCSMPRPPEVLLGPGMAMRGRTSHVQTVHYTVLSVNLLSSADKSASCRAFQVPAAGMQVGARRCCKLLALSSWSPSRRCERAYMPGLAFLGKEVLRSNAARDSARRHVWCNVHDAVQCA